MTMDLGVNKLSYCMSYIFISYNVTALAETNLTPDIQYSELSFHDYCLLNHEVEV